MAEEKDLKQAQGTFDTLCQTLDGYGWHYQKDAAALKIECKAQGDDLPIGISVIVDAERNLVMLISHIPFVIPEDKRLDVAVAVSVVNNILVDGSFDYDITDGTIVFRMTASFHESVIGDGLFQYMISCSCAMVDKYNDKFLAIGKGMISIADFVEKE